MNQNTNTNLHEFLDLARRISRAVRNMAPLAEIRALCSRLAEVCPPPTFIVDAREVLQDLRRGCDELERIAGTGEPNGPAWDRLRNTARMMVRTAVEYFPGL